MDGKGRFATQVAPLFPVEFSSSVLEETSKALRDGVSIQDRSGQEDRDGAKARSDYSSSPWFTRLSLPQTVIWVALTSLLLRLYRRIPLLTPTLPSKVHCLWIPYWLVVVRLFLLDWQLLGSLLVAVVMSRLESLEFFVRVVLLVLPELERTLMCLMVGTRLKSAIMEVVILADGIETGVSPRSSVSGSRASTGRPGFRSARGTHARHSKSLNLQSIRAHTLVRLNNMIIRSQKNEKSVGAFRW